MVEILRYCQCDMNALDVIKMGILVLDQGILSQKTYPNLIFGELYRILRYNPNAGSSFPPFIFSTLAISSISHVHPKFWRRLVAPILLCNWARQHGITSTRSNGKSLDKSEIFKINHRLKNFMKSKILQKSMTTKTPFKRSNKTQPLQDTNITQFRDETQIRKIWKNQYSKVLNLKYDFDNKVIHLL